MQNERLHTLSTFALAIDLDIYTFSSIQTSNTHMMVKLAKVIKNLELVNTNITQLQTEVTYFKQLTILILLVAVATITTTGPIVTISIKTTLVSIVVF